MRSEWNVELRTGYDLSDNDIIRIKERIEESLTYLETEYLGVMIVKPGFCVAAPRAEEETTSQK